MVCVLTLTLQLCIRCIHMGILKLPKEGQPRYWICGRSLEGSQRLIPRTSPALTPQFSSQALPGFTSITLESRYPHLLGLKWDMGTQEIWEDSHAGFGVLWPRRGSGTERFATESLDCFSPHHYPWSLHLPEPWSSHELGEGGRPASSWCPLGALHIWPRHKSAERMEGMSAALSTQISPPHTALYRWGDHRPLRKNRMWSLGGAATPRGTHGHGPPARGWPLRAPGSDVSREGSGGISAYIWRLTSLSARSDCLL